jgi:hypothetical protein
MRKYKQDKNAAPDPILQRIQQETDAIRDAAEASMETIDWEENAQIITRSVRFRERRRAWSFSLPAFNWKLAVPTLASVLLLGVWLGYLLFYNVPSDSVTEPYEVKPTAEFALARLETTLAKKEMQGYFQQTQMLLTDLMRQCDEEGMVTWAAQVNRKRVKTLLNKNRYFRQDINNPQLLSTRPLLEKIEWLLYEILTLNDEVSCRKLQHLQDYIRRERLLLKLRLVSKDISFKEV